MSAAVVERMVRDRAAAQGWDPDEVLIPLGITTPAAPAPVAAVKPKPDPKSKTYAGRNAAPPAPCNGGCGRMVGFTAADVAAGAAVNAGFGRCRTCRSRADRDTKPRVRTPQPPAPCAGGCGQTLAFRAVDHTEHTVRHHGHGMCGPCDRREWGNRQPEVSS